MGIEPVRKVVSSRRTGSDIGNNPSVRGAGWGTPTPQRSRRDKVFGAIDDGTTPPPMSRTVASRGGGGFSGSGGGGDWEPPDDTSGDPFGPGDFGDDEPGDFSGDPGTPASRGMVHRPHLSNNGGDARGGSNRTPRPNRILKEGLENKSYRSMGYNPSVDPRTAGMRSFGRVISNDAEQWGQFYGWDAYQVAQNTGELFQDYLYAESEGVGEEFVQSNVPQRLRSSFNRAARRGQAAFQGAVNFAKRASPLGVSEYFNKMDQDAMGGISGFSSEIHGQGALVDKVDPVSGEITGKERAVVRDGRVAFGTEHIQTATDVAQRALTDATSKALPSEPGSAMASIKTNVNAMVSKYVGEIAKSMEDMGADSDTVQKVTGFIKDAALNITNRWARQAGDEISGSQRPGSAGSRDEASVRYAAKKFASIEDAFATMENRPGLKSQVQEYLSRSPGESVESMFSADGENARVFEDGDMAFQFGGSGASRGGVGRQGFTKRMNGLWRGPVGQAMYGMYIGQRMWNMGMGETMRQAQAYGNFTSDIGNLGGSGAGALSGEGGFAARQSLGQLYMGRGAYQEFGAFMDLPFYMAAGGNDGTTRMMASGKAGLTVGAEFAIGGAMAGMAGMEALAAALPVAGAVIGGGMILGSAGMELYNGAHPDQDPVTWSSMFKGMVEGGWRKQAEQKYITDHPEWAASNRKQSGNVYAQMYGAQVTVADTSKLTLEDLSPYLSAEQIGAMDPVRNEKVDAAMEAGKGFFKYGLDTSAVTSATQALFRAAGNVSPEMVDAFGNLVQQYGTQGISEAAQFASNSGYLTGTTGFTDRMKAYAAETDPTRRAQMFNQQARFAQYGSQVAGYMSSNDAASANWIAERRNVQTQAQASTWMRMNQAVANFQTGPISVQQQDQMAGMASSITPFVGGYVAQFGNLAGEAGYDPMAAMQSAAGMGMSSQQWAATGSLMSGDMRQASYWANQGMLDQKYGLYDVSGNLVSETNGARAMDVMSRWAGQTTQGWINGDGLAQGGRFATAQNVGTSRDMASRLLNTNNSEILDAFMNDGTRGIQALARRDAASCSDGLCRYSDAPNRATRELPVGRRVRLAEPGCRFNVEPPGPPDRHAVPVPTGRLQPERTFDEYVEPIRDEAREQPVAAHDGLAELQPVADGLLAEPAAKTARLDPGRLAVSGHYPVDEFRLADDRHQ